LSKHQNTHGNWYNPYKNGKTQKHKETIYSKQLDNEISETPDKETHPTTPHTTAGG
jgi:hypothetical protein